MLYSYIISWYYKLLTNTLLCQKNTSVICKYTFKFLFDSNTTLHIVELDPQNEMVDNGFLSETKVKSIKDLSLC